MHGKDINGKDVNGIININRDIKIDVCSKALTATVSCSNLGQFVLYCTLKLKHELHYKPFAACRIMDIRR